MKTSRGPILVLIVSWGWLPLLGTISTADLYQGRVMDEETGEPSAGAVLDGVVSFRSRISGFEGTRDFLKGFKKRSADSDGKSFFNRIGKDPSEPF